MARVDHDSMASLPNLPTDILLLILGKLAVQGLAALSQTSSFFHDLVCLAIVLWPRLLQKSNVSHGDLSVWVAHVHEKTSEAVLLATQLHLKGACPEHRTIQPSYGSKLAEAFFYRSAPVSHLAEDAIHASDQSSKTCYCSRGYHLLLYLHYCCS